MDGLGWAADIMGSGAISVLNLLGRRARLRDSVSMRLQRGPQGSLPSPAHTTTPPELLKFPRRRRCG